MSRIPIAAACCVLAAVASVVPASAKQDTSTRSDWFNSTELEYLSTYEKCWEALKDQCGANLVDDYEPSMERLQESTARMKGWLNPPEAAPVAEETAPVAETTSYSGGVSNSTVMCESGGDYSANTGNGYYGGYQFDSGTWDAYGPSQYAEASDAPPSVQDAAAASVPYDAWPNC